MQTKKRMSMDKRRSGTGKQGFGAAPVYFTAISSILGAILFLRLGYATGMLGFWGAMAMILVGHLITIPTALAVSELATNTRVEGGGEYFIISRSLGLKVGTTIGITLFLSQAISVAFYTISFAEAFQPLFQWWVQRFGWELPRQAVSVPTLLITAAVILKKGTGSGVKLLYIVVTLLFLSLLLFFLGKPVDMPAVEEGMPVAEEVSNFGFYNADKFFIIFAICFPAFTGMTAGVGLSGELRDPGKAIPLGTMLGTLTGLVVYILVVYKLSVSAPQSLLVSDQLVMSRIAVFGKIIIPVGLAAATLSSALGGMLVAPRTLQAIASDKTIPLRKINIFLARNNDRMEPRNASWVSYAIALVFIMLGDVNSVAQIISMFFLITYGTLCLSSFLNHFGAPPSYRPRFKSRWYISLAGFLLSVWVMFRISQLYTIVSYAIIILIYIYIERSNKNKKGFVTIFKGVLFQLNRKLQVYMQKHQTGMSKGEWRPAALCISSYSFERDKVLELMKWMSYQHGFGTYFHYIKGYYDRHTYELAQKDLQRLIDAQKEKGSALYIDTMISPSYTSAIAQVIQTPSISGMENNMVVFEYDQHQPQEMEHLFSNVELVRAGNFDVCILATSEHVIRPENGIHVWINDPNDKNTNFMILLGYIIMAHPDWKRSYIKIFLTSIDEELTQLRNELRERIAAGRLPITMNNIEIIPVTAAHTMSEVVEEHSKTAALTMIGFHEDILKHEALEFFTQFRGMGDILFVNSIDFKDIR